MNPNNPSLDQIPDNWYESFFSAPINAFWEALVPHDVTLAEVTFIERQLRIATGARILDVPCGSGRHSLALSRRGYRVTGVDLSQDCVERLRSSVAAEKLSVEVLHQNMERFAVADSFDGAICFGNSFGYLTHEGMQRFLRALHSCLRAKARFIIDSGMTAESILANMKPAAKYEMDGYEFELRNEYDIARSRLLTHTKLQYSGQVWRQSFSHAVYTCAELQRLLDANGFEVGGLFAGTDDTPFALGKERLLLVAQRR